MLSAADLSSTLYQPVSSVDNLANTLDSDKTGQNAGPDLNTICLTL